MFSLSPSVNVREIDLTTSVPAVATSIGAIVGNYVWGPVDEATLVSREDILVSKFGKPTNINFGDWFSAANFLAYGINLQVVRTIDGTARNASDNAATLAIIKNATDFEVKNTGGVIDTWGSAVVAKYPGTAGNDIVVEVSNAESFNNIRITHGVVTGGAFVIGDTIIDSGATSGASGTVASVISTTEIEVKLAAGSFLSTGASSTLGFQPSGGSILGAGTKSTTSSRIAAWDANSLFDYAPTGTQLAIVVKKAGVAVEQFLADSSATAKDFQGNSIYVDDVLDRTSGLIWGNAPTLVGIDAGFASKIYTLSGGVDSGVPTTGNYEASWASSFANPETIDINLCMAGNAGSIVGKWLIQNIAEVRKDCVAFVSPSKNDVVGVAAPDATLKSLRDVGGALNVSSSYGVMDGNFKYQYDRYNDAYRWVPLNGDIAGLCARTDDVADPWYSPAGFNRGAIKNVIKLAFNPDKAQRDELYKNGINPVVTFKGQGTVMYGDKTMQTKPSAFDRINVRRLFIVLEKAIATASKYTLFEFNDSFTRARFVQMVEPFLRDVKGRRGIYDFKVVADETNNTPEVIDRNEFIGDIYIKPARSINSIMLNFVAVKSGVNFQEVIG